MAWKWNISQNIRLLCQVVWRGSSRQLTRHRPYPPYRRHFTASEVSICNQEDHKRHGSLPRIAHPRPATPALIIDRNSAIHSTSKPGKAAVLWWPFDFHSMVLEIISGALETDGFHLPQNLVGSFRLNFNTDADHLVSTQRLVNFASIIR